MNLRAERSHAAPRPFVRRHDCSPYTVKLIEELRSAREAAHHPKLIPKKITEKTVQSPSSTNSLSFDFTLKGIRSSNNIGELLSAIPDDCSLRSAPPSEVRVLQNKLSICQAEAKQLDAEKKTLLNTIETLKKNVESEKQQKEIYQLKKEFQDLQKKTEVDVRNYKAEIKKLSDENARLVKDNQELHKKMANKAKSEVYVQTEESPEKKPHSGKKSAKTQVQSARTCNGLNVTSNSSDNVLGAKETQHSRNAVISEKKSQDAPSGHKPLYIPHKERVSGSKQTKFQKRLFDGSDIPSISSLRPPSASVSGDKSSDEDIKITELQNVIQRLNEQYQTARINYNNCGSTQERQAIKQYLSSLCTNMEKTSLELFNCKKRAGLF